MTIRVMVWNEFLHEKKDEAVKKIYPDGMHKAIASYLSKSKDFYVKTATLEEPSHGLTNEVLDQTDVLIWWGHMAHNQVDDQIVLEIGKRVREGMSVILLHSAHASKLMKELTGCNGSLSWREAGEKEILWNINPNHPITKDMGDYFILEQEETYGEPFGVSDIDELLMISWFSGGNVFRSAWIKNIQNGKLFYFQPGHETYPTFKNEKVLKIIENAVRYLKPEIRKNNVENIWQKEPIV